MAKPKQSRPKEFWDKLVGKERAMTTVMEQCKARELTPDEFRVFATVRKWPKEVIDALLAPPVASIPFFIGVAKVDPGGRQLVVIKPEAPIKPLRSAA